jgi:hypothetical protein
MIYMAGDNNLAVDMAYAMEQIKGVAGEGDNSPNLFVYYDGNSPSIPTLYCDFSDPHQPKYVRSFKVPDKLFPVPGKQNENAADTKSVKNFVDWCVNKRPPCQKIRHDLLRPFAWLSGHRPVSRRDFRQGNEDDGPLFYAAAARKHGR